MILRPDECPHCGSQIPPRAPDRGDAPSLCGECGRGLPVHGRAGPEVTVPVRSGRVPEPAATVFDPGDADVPADASPAWSVGQVILNRYRVLGVLGQGGMGKVYRVRHLHWGVDLAVKQPRYEIMTSAAGVEHFEREAETWVKLGLHPHTVSCYYIRRINGLPAVFAEYVSGGSLHDWIYGQSRGPRPLYRGGPEPSLARILDTAVQFAWGLQYAHDQELVHLDVKPANVMVTPDGLVKVTDFGLALAMSGPAAPDDAGGFTGTPQYLRRSRRPART